MLALRADKIIPFLVTLALIERLYGRDSLCLVSCLLRRSSPSCSRNFLIVRTISRACWLAEVFGLLVKGDDGVVFDRPPIFRLCFDFMRVDHVVDANLVPRSVNGAGGVHLLEPVCSQSRLYALVKRRVCVKREVETYHDRGRDTQTIG